MHDFHSPRHAVNASASSARRKSGTTFAAPPAQESTGVDWMALWFSVRERWWVFAIAFTIAIAGAAAYLILEPKLYTATATIQVEVEGQQVVNVREVVAEDFRSAEALKTVEQALGSRMLALRVVRAAKLTEDKTYGEPEKGHKYSEGEMANILVARCDFKLRKGSRLIDLNVDDTDDARARLLARTFVSEYIAENFEQRGEVGRSANDFLVKEADRLRIKLEASEQALQEYREKYGAVSLEERQNIVSEKLKDLNRSVTQAKSARIKAEADYQSIKASEGRPYRELLSLASVASLPEVAELQTQINLKESEFATLKERYLSQHPKYQAAESQLTELRQNLQRAVTKAGDSVRNLLETTKENENRLTVALREQEQVALELSKIGIPYNVLQREMEADKTLFESVIARLKEMKVAQGVEKTNVRLIEAPYTPWKPNKPRKIRVAAAAILGGLLLGGMALVLLNIFDSTIRSVDQAEEVLGVPCLAVVPDSKFSSLERCLVLKQNPGSAEAEGIRSLRTSLALLGQQEKPQVTLFGSALPGEGKSFVAANYASALAEQGLRTLLIDADLRRPGLGFIFVKANKSQGLSDYLSGHASFDEVHQPLGVENLSIISAGQRGSNPAELLASEKFAGLIEAAGGRFDHIVIDSAPVNLVSDTLLLVKHVTNVCLVVRARKTTERTLSRAAQLLQMADCAPVGFVLNRMPRTAGFGYYSYYEGEYGSEGVYGTVAGTNGSATAEPTGSSKRKRSRKATVSQEPVVAAEAEKPEEVRQS